MSCILQAKELLTACRDAGVNFFDNAEVYAKGQAEEIMGKAFKVSYPSVTVTLKQISRFDDAFLHDQASFWYVRQAGLATSAKAVHRILVM